MEFGNVKPERKYRNKKEKEEAAKEEFTEITPLLQAAFLVGSGAYTDQATTDEILQVAFDILETEEERRETYKNTPACIERVNTLTRHYARAQDVYNRVCEQDLNDHSIGEARDQMKTYDIALHPLSGMDLIIAEQEIRQGDFDLKKLPPLQDPLGQFDPGLPDFQSLTDDDYKQFFNNDRR